MKTIRWQNVIKKLADEKGWNARYLSKRLNVTLAAVHSWFSNRRIPNERNCDMLVRLFKLKGKKDLFMD